MVMHGADTFPYDSSISSTSSCTVSVSLPSQLAKCFGAGDALSRTQTFIVQKVYSAMHCACGTAGHQRYFCRHVFAASRST